MLEPYLGISGACCFGTCFVFICVAIPFFAVFGLLLNLLQYYLDDGPERSRREQRNLNIVRQSGRVVAFADVAEELKQKRGTLLVEDFARIWWTPDDVQALSREFPDLNEETQIAPNTTKVLRLMVWIFERYTSPDTGTAMLIDDRRSTEKIERLLRDVWPAVPRINVTSWSFFIEAELELEKNVNEAVPNNTTPED